MNTLKRIKKSLKGVSTEDDIERLSDEWGTVYVVHRGYLEEENWIVRNHTDEGLGADNKKRFRGETLEEAVEKAIREESI